MKENTSSAKHFILYDLWHGQKKALCITDIVMIDGIEIFALNLYTSPINS